MKAGYNDRYTSLKGPGLEVVQAGSGITIYNIFRIYISRTAGLFSAYNISFFIIFKINYRTEARFLISLIFQDFASFSNAFNSISTAPPCEKNQKTELGEPDVVLKNKKIKNTKRCPYIYIHYFLI